MMELQLPGLPGSTAGSSSPNTGSGATTPGSRSAPDGPGNNPLVLPLTITSYLCPLERLVVWAWLPVRWRRMLTTPSRSSSQWSSPHSPPVSPPASGTRCAGESRWQETIVLSNIPSNTGWYLPYLNLFYNYSAHIYY